MRVARGTPRSFRPADEIAFSDYSRGAIASSCHAPTAVICGLPYIRRARARVEGGRLRRLRKERRENSRQIAREKERRREKEEASSSRSGFEHLAEQCARDRRRRHRPYRSVGNAAGGTSRRQRRGETTEKRKRIGTLTRHRSYYTRFPPPRHYEARRRRRCALLFSPHNCSKARERDRGGEGGGETLFYRFPIARTDTGTTTTRESCTGTSAIVARRRQTYPLVSRL